nr:MAG TPA: hypothetical protein [Caudoviricetes sp.]
MESECYINGFNIWEKWKAYFGKGAYEALLTPAPLKAFIENECRLEHGKRVIPSNPKMDERNLTLSIFVEGATEEEYLRNYESFVNELHKGLIEMKVPCLNKVFKFYYNGCQKYGDYGFKKGKFSLKLREPNPADRRNIL